ncbi:MAG TPA: primosomal protein N', partial [Ruminococcaceae bacterium]|nr:primosomal protein N' [Oscillospiraceae bacterium]
MPETIIADVAVENTAYSFDREFRYLVPQPLAGEAKAGCRVMVPFGRGNRTRQGMILSVCRQEETEQLKSIAAVLDKAPLLTREMLLMVPWLSDRCFCTLFETVRLLLPVGINLK